MTTRKVIHRSRWVWLSAWRGLLELHYRTSFYRQLNDIPHVRISFLSGPHVWFHFCPLIALFKVTSAHLHYKKTKHVCEAILAQNCLTSMLDYIVNMQMRKLTVKRAIARKFADVWSKHLPLSWQSSESFGNFGKMLGIIHLAIEFNFWRNFRNLH